MKKLFKINLILAAVCMLAMAGFTACEGPAGVPGEDGENGKDGTNGTNGLNSTASCIKCHNSSSDLLAKSKQLNHSLHGSGHAWEVEGTRNNCAPCHSNEGFLDVIAKNPSKKAYNASAAALANPTSFGCRTCHKIHTAYDSTDYALTTTTPVDMLIDTSKTLLADFPAGSSSHLCAKCHQPRLVKTMDFANNPTGTYTGINFRWGTHYGTQAAIASGRGAKEFTGAVAYTNSAHKAGASCASCHAAPAPASGSSLSGGHTFHIVDDNGLVNNTNGCKSCHADATVLAGKITNTRNEINTLVNQLGAKLDEIGGANGGILQKDASGYTGYVDIFEASSNPTGKWNASGTTGGRQPFPTINNKQAAAIVNFQLVLRDGSHGIHNFPYTKALLTNTIAAL
jgi:hypothetical protein